MHYYHCSIYNNTPGEEHLTLFFEKGGPPSEISNFIIPLPPPSLANWSFSIIGCRRETGGTPLCKKAINLQALVDLGSTSFTIS
ncbi:MAG: hypothetical protein HRU43_02875 [Simkaniaceae bacterium]|nr:hypothetical protein [Simkaniaceae bacterium]